MNYWSEVGWITIPMDALEIGFAIAMCLVARFLDKQKA